MEHKIASPILAVPCFSIFANYDGNIPDATSFFLVATEELAREVVEILNENPRSWTLGYAGRYTFFKSYAYAAHFVPVGEESSIFTNLEDLKASGHLEKDGDD